MHWLVRIARVVADPPGVHFRVVTRLDAINHALIVMQPDVLPARIHRRNRRRFLQQPDALLEEKILVEQRADRAEIDDIT